MSPCERLIVFCVVCVLRLQMIARGKNASDLFPAVVKNVACKNIEVRNEQPHVALFALYVFLYFACNLFITLLHVLKGQQVLIWSHLITSYNLHHLD